MCDLAHLRRKSVMSNVMFNVISKRTSGSGVFLGSLAIVLLGMGSVAELPPGSTGDLFLSDFNGDALVSVRSDGSAVVTTSHPDLDDPRGISMGSDGALYVSSQGKSRILVFDRDLNYLRQFTHPDLLGPTGSAFGPTGRLYVSSFLNDRVVVFETDGTHVKTIQHADLDGPNCVAFAGDGSFLVAAGEGDQVVGFDASDNYSTTFTGGGLDSPMSIAFATSGHFFVSGGLSNNVVEFDASRQFVASYSVPGFSFVQSIAVDDAGRLFVSNFLDGNVTILNGDGTKVATIGLPGVSNGRGLAFDQVSVAEGCRKGTVDMLNGFPASIFRINGSTGDRARRLTVSAANPLSFELVEFPGNLTPGNFPYVTYAALGENRDVDATPFPRNAGSTCFATPVTGGASLTVFNTLGSESAIGVPIVPGTPFGPGVFFQVPRLNAGQAGRTVTLFSVVADRRALRSRIGITNAIVVEIVP